MDFSTNQQSLLWMGFFTCLPVRQASFRMTFCFVILNGACPPCLPCLPTGRRQAGEQAGEGSLGF